MKKQPATILFIFMLILFQGQALLYSQAKDYLRETSAERDARMAWWRDARFGMFIHWGVYSVPAGTYNGAQIGGLGEWIMHEAKIPVPEYEKFARQFNPVKFDARAWVKIAADAGMKYIVITSKHHDGFALWDSKVSDYDVIDFAPFGRDILKELSEACQENGIRLCFYHSIMDWHHPDAKGENFARYRDEYMIPQVKELLSGYGNIGVLWFDGEWIEEWTEPQGKNLYNLLRNIKPDLIINNRIGKGRKGMDGLDKGVGYAGDFGTPEQRIPPQGIPSVDWESCMTMNKTWGYKTYDHEWKSETDLIHKLIDIASKGGNFLLNVGPTADGLIPNPSIERLAAMGRWMKVNNEAIYGTSASPYDQPEWGRFTKKPGKLFAHIFEWPANGQLFIPANDIDPGHVYMLADKQQTPLNTMRTGDGVVIQLPEDITDPVASVVVIAYDEGK